MTLFIELCASTIEEATSKVAECVGRLHWEAAFDEVNDADGLDLNLLVEELRTAAIDEATRILRDAWEDPEEPEDER